MLFSLLLVVSTASASDFSPNYDFALETGYLGQNDKDWASFGNPENTVGFRFGYHLSPKLSILASYQTVSAMDSTVSTYYYEDYNDYDDYDDDYDDGYEDNDEPYAEEYSSRSSLDSIQMSIRANQFTFGPKASWNVRKWFSPYATLQGLVVHGHLRMGNELSPDDSITFLKASAFAFGAVSGLGLELKTRPIKGKFQLNTYFEWGYGLSTNMNFQTKEDNLPIGDLQYRGGYIRYGIGTRF